MSRNFYIGLLVIAAGILAVFLYRTNFDDKATNTDIEQVIQSVPDAEFGGVSLRIEYAMTPEARELGLGGRTEIPEDYGMLFVFPEDDYYGFWMEDAMVPLDIFWLDAQGQTIFIMADIATSTYPDVFYPTTPARYVLETAAGFTRKHNVTIGTPLRLKNFPIVSQ
ncbi:DUF192 domain-containing protein [Candidatus Kaiserbacteria bacterium]|nr:DUF192 domain-containing protein [Candidatus Kaiserbacteria bacterium]